MRVKIDNPKNSPMVKLSHSMVNYPIGLYPFQIYKAYNFNKKFLGLGETIAIIDAYNAPNIEGDLDYFSKEFGLPKANLEIHYPQGVPDTNDNWIPEIALDTQWVHAMAPLSKIMLVLAKSESNEDLYGAVQYAVDNGATIVSISWGGDLKAALQYLYIFNNKDVTFIASTGDSGGRIQSPAASPNVLSVGGTSLYINNNSEVINENAWSDGGGGICKDIPIPLYQSIFGISKLTNGFRGIPDVSFNADTSISGVSVYITMESEAKSGWYRIGGTSLGAPAWAGIIADIKGAVKTYSGINISNTDLISMLYNAAGRTSYTNEYCVFRDIITGEAGPNFAIPGYDFITGLGSPNITNLINFFISRTCKCYQYK